MAVKTITVDLEAYDLLARLKRGRQSFSQVIKEHLGKAATGADLDSILDRIVLDEETVDAIEAEVQRRRSSPAAAPEL
jgi:predicted CopG family antitoxin